MPPKSGHADVENRDVRDPLRDQLERARPGRGLADELDIVHVLEIPGIPHRRSPDGRRR